LAGAKVVHGDWDSEGGRELDVSLSSGSGGGEMQFVRTDVTNYDSVLSLFDVAWKKYSRVDIAVSNAGIQEIGNLFDPGLDLDSIKKVCSLNLSRRLQLTK
jgi:NAD(P)-dependent dehydrogenase (short-subunit alcohol dehydrogenase family)